jgi:hypothetical protein
MQGIFIKTEGSDHEVRPKSKKQIKELVAAGKIGDIYIEATSFFGNEFDGFLDYVDGDIKIDFVGPNPHADRRFYGTITVKDGKVTVK